MNGLDIVGDVITVFFLFAIGLYIWMRLKVRSGGRGNDNP
jgi:hypothetical protein